MEKHLILVLSLFLLSALACGGVGGSGEAPTEVEAPQEEAAGGEVVAPTEEVVEPPTEEAVWPTPNESGGLPAPNIEVNGGFSTDYREVNDLPSLTMPVGGRGPSPCERSSPDSSFAFINIVEAASQLCVFDYPMEAGSPPLTLTLTAPNGQTYSGTFTLVQGENYIRAINGSGEDRGWVDDMMSNPPAIIIYLNFTADLPTGTWSVHGDNGIFSADATFERELSQALVSVYDVPPGQGPFYQFRASETMFDTGDIVYFVGAGYAPNSELAVAAYTPILDAEPDAATGMVPYGAPYATTVMTDATGSFVTTFVVGSATPDGEYVIVADPYTHDWIDPFIGRFYIRSMPGMN